MTNIQYIHITFEIWGAIFCVIATVCVYATRHAARTKAKLLMAVLVTATLLNLFESMAYYYRGNETDTGYIMVRLTNFVVFACGYLLAAFAFRYIVHLIRKQGGRVSTIWTRVVYAICGGGLALLAASRFFDFYYAFDEHNRYYRLTDTYWIIPSLEMLVLAIILALTVKNRRLFGRTEFIAFLLLAFAPLISLVIQVFYYGISVSTAVTTVIILILFAIYEMKYAAETVRKERELGEERSRLQEAKIAAAQEKVRLLKKQVRLDKELVRLYTGQIQPHFIYNSLTVIRSLLDGRPEAKEALDRFTRFLRGIADMLATTECVTADREFKTVENYLHMEKMQFGDRLAVELDTADRDFLLPPFTVQTLVENAIRHGIRKNKDGRGTLTLKSYETDTAHVIEITDDGAGFDTAVLASQKNDAENHVGIANVRNRLALMSDGTLTVESSPGAGTRVRVSIPKQPRN